ncbi:MAG: HNH endonuclease [Ruminococcus sp.]|nr:HNH endonuclease [Ruminococcus sp.]
MKRKFKSFLNKRVVTSTLSIAMLFNMAAYFPASVFADETSKDDAQLIAEMDGHKYQLFDVSMSWTDAEKYCQDLGGHLLTITSPEEQQFINDNLLLNGEKDTYYIGLHRESAADEWKWVTEENVDYLNWERGEPNYNTEHYVQMYNKINTFGRWNNTKSFVSGLAGYSTSNAGFICEWESDDVLRPSFSLSPYVLFSGSETSDFTLNCWRSTFNGDVYTGKKFISNASELYLNGKANAADSISAYGWNINIEEKNEYSDKEEMPDWDSRIIAMAEGCETSDQDVVYIEDKSVVNGALKTSGDVIISGTTFDGNCYIIADGDITYNVNDFISSGNVVLYSRNGNITINGTIIDMNGIIYAPNGTVRINSNITNINGRVFADCINFSGSIFNVNGSDSDWELLGRKSAITKTYTFDEDFDKGEYDGLGLNIADELTLEQRIDSIIDSSENEYKDNKAANGIALNVKSDKTVLTNKNEIVNVQFGLSGFGDADIAENAVDIIILVDESWSMESYDRMPQAKTAAKEIIKQMKPVDRCAIMGFSWYIHDVQDFTSDKTLLNTAIDNIRFNDGTDIANGLNHAVDKFKDSDSQKYIILMSDGEDSSASAQAALNAYEQGITICALSIGNDSNQMKTIANNTNGYYKNSPTAEQIGEMMNMFADVVFNNAGTDVTFTATLNKNVNADIESITAVPTEVIDNDNGTKTLKWTYDKITIDQIEQIKLPISVSEIESGLNSVISDISCTYYNRAGVSTTIYADDIIIPAHTYKQNGSWTTVYDSKIAGTDWKNIYWNGKLYDDGVISVMAQAGDDLNAFGEWKEVINHQGIVDLKGRYIRVKVEMTVSSSGKTPELYDITLLSDGADEVDYVNNAPIVTVAGNTATCINKKITLISNAEDDVLASRLSFNWSCDSENVQILNPNKPYTSFIFTESGNYEVVLEVSDGNSTSVITKTIKVLNDETLIKPIIDIEVPSIVKSGEVINGRVVNLNDAEISDYEVMVGGSVVTVATDGRFSFSVPDSDTFIGVEAKAFNIVGVSGTADKTIIVDGSAPKAELKSDKNDAIVNETVTITAFVDDENGISSYTFTLDGKAVTLDSNYQYSFIPTAVGSYTFELNATDMAGHTSSANLTVNVEEGKPQPVVNYSIPRVIVLGETRDFEFISDSATEITVKVNDEAVQLDAEGKFSYTPDTVGNLKLDIHASNGGNIDTNFTLTVPVVKVELVSNKTTYSDEEPVAVELVCSDNLIIASQTATIDNIPYAINNNVIHAENLDAGSHEVIWYIEDENGNIFTGAMTIAVEDITPPEIEVTLSENALKAGESVEAIISATDRYGISSISAKFDNKNVAVSNNKVILNKLTAGAHVLAVTAIDNNGVSATYNYEFTVSNGDTIRPELDVSVTVGENQRIEIVASATDNSGSVEITGTVNDQKLTFTDGVAYYNPNGLGDFKIVIRAEDASGNFIEKTQTVTISEQITEYELELSVVLDKNNVKPNENVNISVKTNTLLEDVTISCTSDGGKLTQVEDGYTFVSDKEGVFTILVTAADENGNSVSKTIYITVANEVQDPEEEGEYVNNIVIEPRARVVLESSERTETKMTEEMAELADQLKTPAAVYEYLYNNLNTEYYVGSRKGAIGTYEQKGGNDVDCASLLIAMLRYLGYEAEYVTGEVTITKPQLMELTATDSLENAEKVYMLLGKPLTRFSDGYILERTWVKTIIDGVEYQLDVNFKAFIPTDNISDEIETQNFDFDVNSFTNAEELDALYEQYNGQLNMTELSLSGRKLVSKKISKLPLSLPYACNSVLEETSTIYNSSVITSDAITIVFGNIAQSINSARAYIDPISIQYVPSEDFYDTLGDILDVEKPANIYVPTSNDYILSSQKTICPALYLNNVKVKEWDNARVAIGDKQEMTIAISTSGQTHKYIDSRNLIVGSIVSIVIDTQVVSPQELLTAYENYKAIKNNINENNFFETSYCDNYLNLIGNAYFAQLDVQNAIYSSTYDVYKERELSYGLFSYEPIVEIKSVIGLNTSTTLTKKGNFGVDILGSYNQALSLNGNENDVKSYMFASGYVSSYLESKTLQQFTGIKSISTAEVFRQCAENGTKLKMISSKNKEIISTLKISSEDKEIITQKVDEGNFVIVPENNITINEWTGTAYIIQSSDGMSSTFMITGDKNGGYTTMDLTAYLTIATIGSAVDMYTMIFGFVSLISALIVSPLGIVAACIATVVFAYLVVQWIEDYQETVDLYFKALDGDEEAANALNKKSFFSFLSMAFDGATGGLGGNKGLGPDDVPTSNARKANLSNKGYSDDVVDDVFKMKNADSCSDELLESIAKSGKSAEVADTLSKYSDDVIEKLNKSSDKDDIISLIAKHGDDAVTVSAKSSSETIKAVSNLSDEAAESFFKTVGKNSDELISAINKSSNIDEAVSFVSKYADDGAEIFLRHGDDAIAAVKGCDAPYKAVQIIKNGGLQYGEQAAQAIKKSGDKAIEALTKVPTKDCAELIAKHGDDATTIVTKYGDSAIQAVAKCSNPDSISSAIQLMKNNTKNTVEAINIYGDDAVQALNNVSNSYQSKCSKYIVDYGDDAVDVFTKHGNDAYNALGKCSDSYKKDAITFMNTEEGMAVRYIKRNGDAGVDGLRKYTEINPETGIKNGWTYDTDPLPDDFTCIHSDLDGKTHPDTGVLYERRTVTLGGKESEVVVPRFDSQYDATLPNDLIKSTDAVQFSECNAQLKDALNKSPELKAQFSEIQLSQIENGETPDGFVWHHEAETGRMQLVDENIHRDTRHTGGRAIWGGGSDAR